jgi:hypothetical protein
MGEIKGIEAPHGIDVSVVDIKSLKEIARIPVGFNPARNAIWMAP